MVLKFPRNHLMCIASAMLTSMSVVTCYNCQFVDHYFLWTTWAKALTTMLVDAIAFYRQSTRGGRDPQLTIDDNCAHPGGIRTGYWFELKVCRACTDADGTGSIQTYKGR